jgi:bifunctional enzyme CysN/CysC
VAVNKMDLVDFDQDVYQRIVDVYADFAEKLDVKDLVFIPISALHGDNVVSPSSNMPWYDGATLLHHLETVKVGTRRNLLDFRLPVQHVIRPHQDYRGLAGRVASGTISGGEEVVVLPSGWTTRVRAVETMDGVREEASAGDSVVLTLEDDLDVSRGDMIVRTMNLPEVGNRFDATICWMSARPLDPSVSYVLMHTTRTVRALVDQVVYRIDMDSLHREAAGTLMLNDIGRVEITTGQPIFYDPYQLNHETGSFILVDPFTNSTVAAGMIRGRVKTAESVFGRIAERESGASSPDVTWEGWNLPRAERELQNGHQAAVLWFTGLSGSGKTTIAKRLERELFELRCQTVMLDGDQLRHGLCGDLGFGEQDRRENIRRAGEVARLLFEHGAIVLCSFVSPLREDRDAVRRLLPERRFIEIHVDCALEECKRRDPKGLYARAERGEIAAFTGVTAPYEPPGDPELVVKTDEAGPDEIVATILELLRKAAVLRPVC